MKNIQLVFVISPVQKCGEADVVLILFRPLMCYFSVSMHATLRSLDFF